MGREAECECHWGGQTGRCKVLLEGAELIVRGAIQRRVPFTAMQDAAIKGEEMVFSVDGTTVALALGGDSARRWLEIVRSAPPGLARKLGLNQDVRVRMIGEVDSEELRSALAEAVLDGEGRADLVLVRASTALELEHGLGLGWGEIEGGCPVWVIYPKGKASTLGEMAVREKMRGLGWIDTKVVSVSLELTGLRFIRRKNS